MGEEDNSGIKVEDTLGSGSIRFHQCRKNCLNKKEAKGESKTYRRVEAETKCIFFVGDISRLWLFKGW